MNKLWIVLAYETEQLTEGQAAAMLAMDRIQFREYVERLKASMRIKSQALWVHHKSTGKTW